MNETVTPSTLYVMTGVLDEEAARNEITQSDEEMED